MGGGPREAAGRRGELGQEEEAADEEGLGELGWLVSDDINSFFFLRLGEIQGAETAKEDC